MGNESFRNLALSENGFLFDTRSGNTYTLNRSAVFILKNLMEGKTRTELFNLLAEHYQIKKSDAKRDVDEFILNINKFGLAGKTDIDKTVRQAG